MQGASTGLGSLSVGDIVQRAWNLYRKQWMGLWTIATLIVLPIQIAVALIVRASLPAGSFALHGTIYTPESAPGPILTVIVLGFLSGIIAIGALSKNLLDGYTGHDTGWAHSLAYAWERFGSLLWLALLTGVLVAIGFVLLIIPGIYLVVAWLAAVPVLMFEGIGGTRALSRSRELIRGHWWVVFGALLIGLVVIIGISIAIGAIIGSIVNSDSINGIVIFSALGRVVSDIVTYPIVAAISAVTYVELRARKDNIAPHNLVDVDPETPDPGDPARGEDEPPSHMPDIGLS